MDVLVVGIAGGSGSGKTTLVRELKKRFSDHVSVISHDSYYRAHPELTYDERAALNYDEPQAFETELLIEHLRRLRSGESVDIPIHDYANYDRSTETMHIEANPVILVEGIMIFENKELCSLMDIKVYVDTDADVRLARRIKRDVIKRGRTPESVITQYLTTVKPMHELYVEPSKKNADLVVPEGGKNAVALEILFLRVKYHVEKEMSCF